LLQVYNKIILVVTLLLLSARADRPLEALFARVSRILRPMLD